MILEDPGRSAPFLAKRREKVAGLVNWDSVDAFLIRNIKNVRYLSGFSGTTAQIILTPSETWFLTDFRYMSQAADQTRDLVLHEIKNELDGPAEICSMLKIARLGIEAEHVSVHTFGKLKEKAQGVAVIPQPGPVEKARIVKDEAEMEAIASLNGMIEELLGKAASLLRPGAREVDVAAELEYELRKKGAQGPAFEFIVASGPRGALPHGVASPKLIEEGEAVTLDWGARGWGYHSDSTRTFLPRGVDGKVREIYGIVLEANLAAIEAVKPGAALQDVDRAARDVIAKAGYGEYFGHGTGHGVGLDIHEAPGVNKTSIYSAEPGMVFTIEPGIYLPGIGGVRIEDMVAVTQDGCMILSERIPKTAESMVF